MPLALLVCGVACSHYDESHIEPPFAPEARLTPQRNAARLRVIVERHWPPGEEPGDPWQVTESFNANATVRWINLGPDPAPSVVTVRGVGPVKIDEQAVAVLPNKDQWVGIGVQFPYAQCAPRCVFDLELSWFHAPAGELQVTWNVTASRSAYTNRAPYRSRTWQFRVVPLDGAAIAPDPR